MSAPLIEKMLFQQPVLGILTAFLLILLVGCPANQPPQLLQTGKEGARETEKQRTPRIATPLDSKSDDNTAQVTTPKDPLDGWPKPAVALVLTGQLQGYIEPCGCSGLENQKGGLARRHTLLRQLADERGWPVVPLDVGSQVKGFGKQQEVKFSHAVQGLRTMGYRGITLGDGDLLLTPGELLAAIAGEDGTVSDIVSSNVAVLSRE